MKSLLRAIIGLLLFLLVVLMVGLPFLAFLGAGKITDSPAVAGAISLVAMLGLGVPIVLWVFRRMAGRTRTWIVTACLTLYVLLVGSLGALLLWPLPRVDVSMPIKPTGYWDLPTGSRIAYIHVPAQGERRATPVVRIHGGFTIPDYVFEYDGRPNPRPLDRLAKDGFDVYYYDQVGCGNSARLSDPRAYSIRRDVQDLDAIRQALGAEQIVLIGLSWGSTLAAQYCAAYPNRVAKVIFESPGEIWPALYPNDSAAREDCYQIPPERQARVNRFMRDPRVIFGLCVYRVNPRLMARIVPERDLARFMGILLGEWGETRAVCAPLRMPPRPPLGFGAYAFLMKYDDSLCMADPRAALASNRAPVLVLRGTCEWLKPAVARDYVQALPNSRLVEIDRAGHLLYLEQPEEYLRTVRGFLLDQR